MSAQTTASAAGGVTRSRTRYLNSTTAITALARPRGRGRGRLSLVVRLLLVVSGVLLAAATEFLINSAGPRETLQRWALPLLGVTIVATIAVSLWQYFLEHPRLIAPAWNSRRSPYPGLEAFTEEDAGVFFGRAAEVQHLVDRLHPMLAEKANRFVAVTGPSGAGKSSLVKAGLLPQLASGRRGWLIIPPSVPGVDPFGNLAASLANVADCPLKEDFGLGAQPGAALARWVEAARVAGSTPKAPVLVILDQAEELVTRSGEADAARFLDALGDALAVDQNLWVLATLRSEFLTAFLQSDSSPLFRDPVAVGPLPRERLFQIIEAPAEAAGITFATGLIGRLVDETGGGDALPLLAFTLRALYSRVGPAGIIDEEDYETVGGVAGALAIQADRVVTELVPLDLDRDILPTLLRFVSLDAQEPTRRRVRAEDLSPQQRQVVRAFVEARLLTSGEYQGIAVYEVAHEAILRQWPPLRQAIEAQGDALRRWSELERWARDWENSGRRDAYLLREDRLVQAMQWTAEVKRDGEKEGLVHEFLNQSLRSDRASMRRLSESVARRALDFVDVDPETAVLLSMAAVEECMPTRLAQRALLTSLAASNLKLVLDGHKHGIWSVTWSPDSRKLATGSGDQTVRIWSDGGHQERQLRGHSDWVDCVAWSPDGMRIASASRDGTTRIWDAVNGHELSRLVAPGSGLVRSVAWAPDSDHVVTGSADGLVRIWCLGEQRQLRALVGHEDWVEGVAWSPDGLQIASASGDRTVRLWDATTGEGRGVLSGHTGSVRAVAWSPSGEQLASASFDRTARVWDVAEQRLVAILRGHENWLRGVAWSPDGQRVGTTSDDRTAREWDAQSGIELSVLRGHSSWARGMAWAPNGRLIATCSDDRTCRLWDVRPGVELTALRGHTEWVWKTAWSPDGEKVASASFDRTARIWDPRTGRELAVIDDHSDALWGVAWSNGGTSLATTSGDRTIRVWCMEDGPPVKLTASQTFRGHEDAVWGVAWAPDDTKLASTSGDRTARIWTVSGQEEVPRVLQGHTDTVWDVSWSPDAKCVATASGDRTAAIWDALSGERSLVFDRHDDVVWAIDWSPDGAYVATASFDRTTRVWSPLTGNTLVVLRGHEDWVRAVAWSPDGRYVATASGDGTARIWAMPSGEELAIVGVHRDWIESLTWSPDGRLLATGSRDRTVQVWNTEIDLNGLLRKGRERVFRVLSDSERKSAMLPVGGRANFGR